MLDHDALNPLIGIFGEFVKDTTLRRTQLLINSETLVEDHASIASSPSAYFLLILNNHQLVYLPKTPFAPSLGEFQTTLSRFIKLKHRSYLECIYKSRNENSKVITWGELYTEIPTPTVNLVPIATSTSVTSYIQQFKTLNKMEFHLVRPNQTISAGQIFEGLQSILRNVDAQEGTFVTTRSGEEGLAKEEVSKIAGEAADAGTSEIRLTGMGTQGEKITATSSDLRVRVPVPNLPVGPSQIAERLKDIFVQFVGNLFPLKPEVDAEKRNKLASLRQAVDGD